jgi:hypothetical protein
LSRKSDFLSFPHRHQYHAEKAAAFEKLAALVAEIVGA